MATRVVETRSRRLRVLEAEAGVAPEARPPLQPKPPWIRMKMPSGDVFFDLKKRVAELGLHTVCESASCPNIGECWNRQSLTIMILGGICTRSCQFCDVPTGRPLPPDPDEPRRVAEMLAELGLRHTVITCVDRDDLADGGAAHWAATIRAVKRRRPEHDARGADRRLQGRHRRGRHRARRRPRRVRAQPRDRAAAVAPGARAGELRPSYAILAPRARRAARSPRPA